MDPVQHDIIVYPDAMSCLQVIEVEDNENPYICSLPDHEPFWVLSDKGTCVWFWWVPSYCGIEGNEIVDQLAKETLDYDTGPVTTVVYEDLNPLVNYYMQQKVQSSGIYFLVVF